MGDYCRQHQPLRLPPCAGMTVADIFIHIEKVSISCTIDEGHWIAGTDVPLLLTSRLVPHWLLTEGGGRGWCFLFLRLVFALTKPTVPREPLQQRANPLPRSTAEYPTFGPIIVLTVQVASNLPLSNPPASKLQVE